MTRSTLLGSLRGMLELASDDELATLHHLATLLHPASRDERGVVCVVTARLMGKGRESYGPLYTRNDARDFQHEQSTEAIDALIYWAADVIQKSYRPELDSAATTLCRATPATSSADSHGDTFSRQGGENKEPNPHLKNSPRGLGAGSGYTRRTVNPVVAQAAESAPQNRDNLAGSNPVPDTTNRLGRPCTDCGAGDGEAHTPGCSWTEVLR